MIGAIRQALYDRLAAFAAGAAPPLRIEIPGARFRAGDNETWLRFALLTARPSHPYAGTWVLSQERGIAQVDVVGPETRRQKALEAVAWSVREAFWPANAVLAPTLAGPPLIRLGPPAPHVRDHPAPDPGRLASIVDVYWTADVPRTP